ncbi:MAG TPA: HAMP domain-containing histidine kinase [Dehalococcoidia bacterium]|nr:HAMP domain-containing histidine kinase [Dehalococcoidia bacterium]
MGIADQKKVQEQRQNSQLLATLGEMLTGIANEVNNPLGSILLYSELLMAGDLSPQTKEDLKVIHDEARRAARTMSDLLNYHRQEKSDIQQLEINRVLGDLFRTRRYKDGACDITVTLNLHDRPLLVEGDLSQLNRVFMNLMSNAEEALTKIGGGNITVTTRKAGEWVQISFTDDGPGIPQENLQRIFYPFFTTKQAVFGSGLGLSTCYSIITRYKGLIHARNNEEDGATIIVELPLTDTCEKTPSPREAGITGSLVA